MLVRTAASRGILANNTKILLSRSRKGTESVAKKLYDCGQCPGYCCCYPIIEVTREDIKRLAKTLGLSEADVRSEYVVKESPRKNKLRQHYDKLFKTDTCVFFDQDKRRCTVYAGRPQICRDHPGPAPNLAGDEPGTRCEWYDRMMIEQAMAGKKRKVIMLKQVPWTIDADYPLYDNNRRVTMVLEAYAKGNGVVE